MADESEEDKGDAPSEEFNPLFHRQSNKAGIREINRTDGDGVEGNYSVDNRCDDGTEEVVNSDEELDEAGLGLKYSVMAPNQSCLQKRENQKERQPDCSYKEFLISKRWRQPQPAVNVIKTEYVGEPVLCSLTGFDSDDNLDKDFIKEKRERRKREGKDCKKALSRVWQSSDQENLSKDFMSLNIGDSLQHSHLEGSGRFTHSKCRSAAPPPPLLECQARRQIHELPECPKDREEFYSNFSLLINLGTEAKKDKEKKMSSYKRQMSVELEQWRSTLIEQIWLELRAYISGRSLDKQCRLLKLERQENEKVIDDINNFCFTDCLSEECSDSVLRHDFGRADVTSKKNDDRYRELIYRSVSASFSDVNLTDETVCLQKKALVEVQGLLERLDRYESCYRTTEACKQDNPKYKDPNFQHRVKCLNLWLNITCDLCQKLKLFGRMVGAHSHSIQWPLIDFEFPKPHSYDLLAGLQASIPKMMETEPSDSSDDDDEVNAVEEEDEEVSSEDVTQSDNKVYLSPQHKQVKFQFSDDSSGRSSSVASPAPAEPPQPAVSSTPIHSSFQTTSTLPDAGTSLLNLSRASSEVSLDESRSARSSVYRHYAEKCLRKMGSQKLNVRLIDLFHGSLSRAKAALERPKETMYSDIRAPAEEWEPRDHACAEKTGSSEARSCPSYSRGSSLSEHGEWSSQFILMGLPSFRPMYLFIVRIQLDIIHECLKLRKEQRPIGDPSFLSIRQLIRECKEVLKSASLVKWYYHCMVAAVMWDDELETESRFETDMTEFDEDMKSMLDVYFNYLQGWIYMLQALPEASLGMKSALEEEWSFTKSICVHVMGGEAEAGKKFSSLASSLLGSIGDFLDNGIDDNTRSLFDVESWGDGDENEEGYVENENDEEDYAGDDSDNTEDRSRYRKMAKIKQSVQGVLRSFKNLFNEARERASKALGFAKLLRKDLEIAADLNITVSTEELFVRLVETRHVQVLVPLNAGYMMFIPEKIASNEKLILQLLNVTSGREDFTDLSSKEEGYLLMMRCESTAGCFKEPKWTGPVVHVEPTAETAIVLSHIAVMGLLFVVTHSGTLARQRKHFESIMGKTVTLVNEQTSCHQSITESLSELKTNAVELMVKVSQAIKQVNDKLNLNDIILREESILKLYRETMLKIYDFGFEYQRELLRLITRDQREKVCHMTVSFAIDWMKFVIDRCERGRGTRPRWATQGLEFITIACEPKNIVYLTDEDFKVFQQKIHDCLTHIIGSSDNRYVAPGLSLSKSNLDLHHCGQPSMQRLSSCPEHTRFPRSISARSVHSESSGYHSGNSTSTPSATNCFFFGDNLLSESDRAQPRSACLQMCIEKLEQSREQKLREARIIGKVTNRIQEPDYHINVRRVNFRWQRGIKIGEGQFGKVYTAVNINTGELMAMKEMKFQPNDQQSLKEICDEIKNFEGINHKNLVRYYGVEVHKDEMLMFMEYCDSGSIEEVAHIGLPEYMIRRYTQEIVRAIAHLHENNIVHRDIKGANIFLTSQGHVKLGDFGCSVKLKNQQTMPGENVNLVGTTAYMAPEVITQNKQEGYGRAADIWSLGCVVIEMATGKRPWHELEHNLQVMFKVGTGHSPPVPECLSKEGKNFLSHCLVHDPEKRWTAVQLLGHIFVKCYDDVEENGDEDDSC